MHRTLRLSLAIGLGCVSQAVAQPSDNRLDHAVYKSLFQQVFLMAKAQQSSDSKQASAPAAIDGQPAGASAGPGSYRLHSAMDLTDKESDLLTAIATDYETKLRAFETASGPAIFEARMKLAESDQSPEALRMLKNIDDQRNQILEDHTRQLSADFGDARFKVLDGHARAGSLLPHAPLTK